MKSRYYEMKECANLIRHEAAVPIVVAAMRVRTDYLVTLNRQHFDPTVAGRSRLCIGTPGDALAWLRKNLGMLSE